MQSAQPMGESEPPRIQGPRSLVLGYLTGNDSPTRVRVVASVGMLIMGGLYLGLAALLGYWVFRIIALRWWYGSFLEMLLIRTPFIPAIGALGLGLMAILLARGVKRGSRAACTAAMFSIVVTMIACLVTAVSMGCIAGAATFHIFPGKNEPINMLYWIGVVVGVVVICLCIDLMGFLQWITAQVQEEKPAKKFM